MCENLLARISDPFRTSGVSDVFFERRTTGPRLSLDFVLVDLAVQRRSTDSQ